MKSDPSSNEQPLGEELTPKPSPPLASTTLPTIPFDKQDELLGLPTGMVRERLRTLDAKERACFIAVLNGANFAEAARLSGVTYSKALKLREKIPDLMERRGLTDDVLMAKFESLLEAKETKFFHAKVDGQTLYRDPDTGEQRLIDTTEIIIEDREVEALDVQLRTADLLAKFKGWTRVVESAESVDSHDINVNIVNVGGGS